MHVMGKPREWQLIWPGEGRQRKPFRKMTLDPDLARRRNLPCG